jgi:hypothetical protein
VDGCGLPRQMKREAHGFSRAEEWICPPKMGCYWDGRSVFFAVAICAKKSQPMACMKLYSAKNDSFYELKRVIVINEKVKV